MLKENQTITLEKDSYTLIKLIGEGGQGVIWQVTTSTGKSCVLKTIRTHEVSALGRSQPFDTYILDALSTRMQEEIDFLRVVQTNKNTCFIAECLDYGIIHYEGLDLPAMIMSHYPKDLQQQIPYSVDQQPEYDLPLLLKWLTQLSQALQCTHEQLIDGRPYMHRDIKPPNILLTADSDIRLIDFGIAKQQSDDTGTTSIAHSPAWAAPEQTLPESVRDNGDNVFRLTEKTDLYSLGLVVYYLCTGGAKPKAQEDFSRRSQSIYAQHLMALRDGKVGQLKHVGGLSKEDRIYLQRRLLTSFFAQDEDDTVLIKSVNRLPLPHVISEQIVALTRQLLLPQATERPNAAMAKQQFQHLQQCLLPRLDDFTVNVDSNDLWVGETLELKLYLKGQGLTRPFDWLHVYDQQQQLVVFETISVSPEQAVFLAEENHIQLRLTALQTEGEYRFSIVANVGDKTHTVETTCQMKSSASQLWAQGQHEAALKKELRDTWLNSLEKKALGSVKARYDYLQLLETLQQSVTDDQQQARLLKRYQRAEIIDVKKPFWQRTLLFIGGVFVSVLLLFIGIFLFSQQKEHQQTNNEITQQQQIAAVKNYKPEKKPTQLENTINDSEKATLSPMTIDVLSQAIEKLDNPISDPAINARNIYGRYDLLKNEVNSTINITGGPKPDVYLAGTMLVKKTDENKIDVLYAMKVKEISPTGKCISFTYKDGYFFRRKDTINVTEQHGKKVLTLSRIYSNGKIIAKWEKVPLDKNVYISLQRLMKRIEKKYDKVGCQLNMD